MMNMWRLSKVSSMQLWSASYLMSRHLATCTSTFSACKWEARTLDQTSAEKASDQCCGSSCGARDRSVTSFHV